MLCGGRSDSMPVRLGQFYALVLLLICLAINVAFFAEVREPFLGDDDPTASIKLALSDLDIRAKIAEFYPKIQSKADETDVDETKTEEMTDEVHVPDAPPPLPLPPLPLEEEKPVPRAPRQPPAPPANTLPAPAISAPVVDPFPPIIQPPLAPPPVVEVEKATPKESPPKEPEPPTASVPERRGQNRQAAAVMPGPAPVAAVVQPVIAGQFNIANQSNIADQFKPIIAESKPASPAVPTKPSATPVWETVDTILERPIRYDDLYPN